MRLSVTFLSRLSRDDAEYNLDIHGSGVVGTESKQEALVLAGNFSGLIPMSRIDQKVVLKVK